MTISDTTRQKIRQQANNRCGYCQTHQDHIPWVLEIEHLVPVAKGGSDEEENLWLACHSCNIFKGAKTEATDPLTGMQVPLFNPRFQEWRSHFRWGMDGAFIEGLTACGRATVIALNLNNLVAVTVRRNWILAGWHPPS